MDHEFNPGDLVFLTKYYEDYIKEKNPKFSISLVNRIAKIEEIIDWESDKGRKIKETRKKSGKWADLNIEDNKYLISVYYHDIINKTSGRRGIVEPCVPMFLYHPRDNTKVFFEKIPEWLYSELIKKCRKFDVKLVPVIKTDDKPTMAGIEKTLHEEDIVAGQALLRILSKKHRVESTDLGIS